MSQNSDRVIIFTKVLSPDMLEPVKDLYLNSFPPEERRTLEGLGNQLLEPGCSVNVVWKSQMVAGLCIHWDFDEFLFVEHIAVQPLLRGQKIGETIMNQITEMTDNPVVLEIEPPLDEWSRRRMNFYIRLGFHLLDLDYLQPSYTGSGPGYPMKLLANKPVDGAQLRSFISLIYQRVYKVIIEN